MFIIRRVASADSLRIQQLFRSLMIHRLIPTDTVGHRGRKGLTWNSGDATQRNVHPGGLRLYMYGVYGMPAERGHRGPVDPLLRRPDHSPAAPPPEQDAQDGPCPRGRPSEDTLISLSRTSTRPPSTTTRTRPSS